jgi:hypothetical protein
MLHLRQVFAAKTAEFCETLSAILVGKVAFYDNDRCGSHRSMVSAPRSSFGLCRGTAPVVVAVWELRRCSSLCREREGCRSCRSRCATGLRSSRVYHVS